ncbi:histidine phosphatase family protein [Naasia aerilata]|uniref:histidine phosphatase family protein n=1 Tax=Naasia aerilata TaxID=1162966 RepID=UPI002572CF49|nr:histidine phosphatase family protein [Naasia aerilata]
MVASAVHLVRHGEVENPGRVLYGRLPGFGLSVLGTRMAEAAAGALAGAPVRRVIASPLQRTQESAAPIAAAFGLPIETDERIIEPFNRFEGKRFDFGPSLLTNPEAWPWVSNPFRPSWGEAYLSIAARMIAAVADAYASVEDGDVVLVSHQLPIWMVHRSLAGERLYHDPRRRRCDLSSITTVGKKGNRFVETDYRNPAGALGRAAVDEGAV